MITDMATLSWRKSTYSGTAGGNCVEVAELPRAWRKSSRSDSAGGNCVEVAELWRKSSHSGSAGADCVELAGLSEAVAVRDSKHPDGGVLQLSGGAFSALVGEIKSGLHNR